jgi:hypothetical protein
MADPEDDEQQALVEEMRAHLKKVRACGVLARRPYPISHMPGASLVSMQSASVKACPPAWMMHMEKATEDKSSACATYEGLLLVLLAVWLIVR